MSEEESFEDGYDSGFDSGVAAGKEEMLEWLENYYKCEAGKPTTLVVG